MWRCERCGAEFETPRAKEYCVEAYNGVLSLFGDRHYATYDVCPVCGAEDIDHYNEEEQDEWID